MGWNNLTVPSLDKRDIINLYHTYGGCNMKRKYMIFGIIAILALTCVALAGCKSNKKEKDTDKEGLKVEKEDKDESVDFDDLFDSDKNGWEAEKSDAEDEETSDSKTEENKNSNGNTSSNKKPTPNNTNDLSSNNSSENNNNNNAESGSQDNEVEDNKDNEGIEDIISEDTNEWGPMQ